MGQQNGCNAVVESESQLDQLRGELARVKKAVKSHRDARGDDRCWLDDLELYREVLGEDEVPEPAKLALPVLPAFMSRCARYWQHRQAPDGQPWVTVEELLRTITKARERLGASLRIGITAEGLESIAKDLDEALQRCGVEAK